MSPPARPACLVALVLTANIAAAQLAVPYPKMPSFETEKPGVSTGAALADLDRDGWPDLIIANGNDILRQQLVVHYNRGDGTFPVAPDWRSADIDYHGHLDVGDVNGDGWPDVVVAVYLGPQMWGDPGTAKLYLNDGKGKLGSQPAWVASDRAHSFSVALGDVDGDGDLDLAMATGEIYKAPADFDRLFLNRGGTFSATADWVSAIRSWSMDVEWVDVDGDGDLDLVFAGAKGPDRMYLNRAGKLDGNPAWSSTDGPGHNSNTCTILDADRDGRPDLAISDNRQAGGKGTFRIYRNTGGSFTTTPWWESAYFHNGYTSAIHALDYDRDGDLDLIAGGWWTQTAVYRNDGGRFATLPSWETTGSSVVEAIVSADIDVDGLRFVKGESKSVGGGRKLFRFDHQPVQELTRVVADGVPLTPDKYALQAADGWISLRSAPLTSLALDYTYSDAPDLAISNWDRNKGNYVLSRLPVLAVAVQAPPVVPFGAGETVLWTERFESTVATTQVAIYRSALTPPQLPKFNLLQFSVPVPAGFHAMLPVYLPLPGKIPPILAGAWRYDVELLTLDGKRPISKDGFGFTIRP